MCTFISSGCSQLQDWVLNYRKHPAGWAALLMIHGIPEMSGRLRSKVESYAIYSALFLSFSIPVLLGPPDALWPVRGQSRVSGGKAQTRL